MCATLLAVDAHAHLHPAHRVDRWLASALDNLARLAPGRHAERVVVLVDTARSDGFGRLAGGPLPPGVRVARTESTPAALVLTRGGERLHVLPGRQVVTRERLEVLALGTTAPIPDGLALDAALAGARAAGGLPVVPWSPGKWLGERGRWVGALLADAAREDLVVADSSLRPAGWPLPRLLRRADRLGIPRIAGSDPLPPRGEEAQAGRYGVVGSALEAERGLATAVLALLARGAPAAGTRSSLPAVLWRLARHRRAGARRGPSAS